MLKMLAAEADSLIKQAEKYRAEMESLPEDDNRRAVYTHAIEGLLARSRSLSSRVIELAAG